METSLLTMPLREQKPVTFSKNTRKKMVKALRNCFLFCDNVDIILVMSSCLSQSLFLSQSSLMHNVKINRNIFLFLVFCFYSSRKMVNLGCFVCLCEGEEQLPA